MPLPEDMHWLFWDVEPGHIDVELHADYVLSRVLERGRLEDVLWVMRAYGTERIHAFFRERARPELSPRTLAFWRAFFREEQPWPTNRASRPLSVEPWHG